MGAKQKTAEERYEVRKQVLQEARKKLTLLRSPFRTLWLFFLVVLDYAKYLMLQLLKSPIFYFLVLPTAGVYAFCKYTGQAQEIVLDIDFYGAYFIWWFGLGVLSSIGLGTGMHSGILFLFPHMFKVVNAAKQCPDMNFSSMCDMWWQECPMDCESTFENSVPDAPFAAVLQRIIVPAFLWGWGTATGEIPPYLISRAAALSGKLDEETQELLEETKGNDAFSRMKAWMVDFVERYGFWGVLLMSAWPNAAFDLVGICCGQLNVSFMTFYTATIIGKALIKVNGQAVFFVTWFRSPEVIIDVTTSLVEKMPFLPMTAASVRQNLETALEQVSKGKVKGGETSMVKFIGEKLVIAAILVFAISCVQQFAQQKQKSYDDQELEKLKKSE